MIAQSVIVAASAPAPIAVGAQALIAPGLAERSAYRWVAAGFAVAMAVLCLCVFRAGFVTQTAFGFSSSILIDGGWRLFTGQVPHIDFHSAVGFGYLWLVSLPMRLFGPTPHAMAQAAGLALPLVAAWAWLLCSRRFSPVLALVAAVFVATHFVSFSFFGTTNSEGISFGGQYSRMSWALLFLVAIQAMVPTRRPLGRGQELIEMLGSGALLAALFATKITYLGGGIACIAAAWAVAADGRWKRNLAPLAAGAGATVALLLVATGTTLGAYLRDVVDTGASNETSGPALLLSQIPRCEPLVLALLALWLVLAWPTLRLGHRPSWLRPLPDTLLLAVAAAAIGFGISSFNGTEYVSPIWAFCFLILQGGLEPRIAEPSPSAHSIRVATVALALAVAGAASARLASPIVIRAVTRPHGSYAVPAGNGVDSVPYRGIDFLSSGKAMPDYAHLMPYLIRSPSAVFENAYLLWLRDGLDQLARHAKPGDVIATMDVANPFPFARGDRSPRGDVLYWHMGRNVAAGTAPAPDVLFHDVAVVMVPKRPLMPVAHEGKMAIYGDYIARTFHHVEPASEWWDVWTRPSPLSSYDSPPLPGVVR